LLILTGGIKADTVSLSFYQNITDNIFQNRYGGQDQLSNFLFYAEKTLAKFTLYTQGGISYLYKNPGLSNYIQELGMDYLHPLSEKSALYLSATAEGSYFKSEYNDFNNLSINLYSAFKSYLSPTSILNSNYSLEYKNYKNAIFDYLSHILNLSLDKFFQTKTTLGIKVDWGSKYFFHPYDSQAGQDEGEIYFQGKGKGKGYARKQEITDNSQTPEESQGIQIFSLGAVMAQALGDNIGISFTGQKQWIISGANPFIWIEEFYSIENPSYDRYSWKGYQWESQLTFLIPWDIQVKSGFSSGKKDFPGIESLTPEGELTGMMRRDNRKQFQVRAEKDFAKFSIYLSYAYISNDSNDPFFKWNGNYFAAGIEWNLFFGGGK
jgi:hypothetical protein